MSAPVASLLRWSHAVALTALLLPAACATNGRAELEARLVPLVGLREDELLRRVGVPNRSFETGDRRFLAYAERWQDFSPAIGFGGFYGPPGFGWGAASWPPPVERQCEITFELAEGVVRGFTLRGNACGWGGWPVVLPG